mmetsp:Transcript_18652/g.35587  ORF Transcript_18652/g.35587 Transcript_18652/m.35587 type:complete len:332 (-) Transcript_18652:84-1079(-)
MAGLGRRSHYRKHLTDAVLHDLPLPDESLGQRIARVVGTRGGNMFDVVVAPPPSSYSSGPMGESVNTSSISIDIIYDETASNEKPDVTNNNTDHDKDETQLSSQRPDLPSHNQQNSPNHHHHHHKLKPQLAFLPTKFRKLVWIKRNDFVIVDCGDEDPTESHKNNVLATSETLTQTQSTSATNNGGSGSGSGGGFRYVISHILYKDQVKHIKSKGLWPDDPFFATEEPGSCNIDNTVVVADEVERVLFREKDGEGHRGKNVEEFDDEVDEDSERRCYDEDEEEEECEYHGGAYDDNGIVFEDPMADDFLVNTNRIANLRVDDSSSDDSDDE